MKSKPNAGLLILGILLMPRFCFSISFRRKRIITVLKEGTKKAGETKKMWELERQRIEKT